MKDIEETTIPEGKISKESKDAVRLMFAIENFIRVFIGNVIKFLNLSERY